MSKKHEANVRRDKVIDFQIKLIAVLSFSYVMYGIFTYREAPQIARVAPVKMTPETIDIVYDGVTAIPDKPKTEVLKPRELKSQPITKTISKDIPKVITKEPLKEIKKEAPKVDQPVIKGVDKGGKKVIVKTGGTKKVAPNLGMSNKVLNKRTVDFLPVFPGCDKYATNNERAICFQEKVKKMVLRKFNNGLGEELGLQGRQHIDLHFVIDENGKITDIRARSKSTELAEEAKRVARLLPVMQPAKHGNRSVKMSYDLPIKFDIVN